MGLRLSQVVLSQGNPSLSLPGGMQVQELPPLPLPCSPLGFVCTRTHLHGVAAPGRGNPVPQHPWGSHGPPQGHPCPPFRVTFSAQGGTAKGTAGWGAEHPVPPPWGQHPLPHSPGLLPTLAPETDAWQSPGKTRQVFKNIN